MIVSLHRQETQTFPASQTAQNGLTPKQASDSTGTNPRLLTLSPLRFTACSIDQCQSRAALGRKEEGVAAGTVEAFRGTDPRRQQRIRKGVGPRDQTSVPYRLLP